MSGRISGSRQKQKINKAGWSEREESEKERERVAGMTMRYSCPGRENGTNVSRLREDYSFLYFNSRACRYE